VSDGPQSVQNLSAEQKRALLAELLKKNTAQKTKAFPLSFAQQRLWFLDQLAPGSPFYNQNLAMRLPMPIDVGAFERALNEIVRRHEVLRTTFKTVDGQPLQVIVPALDVPLRLVDLTKLPEEEREAEVMRLATEEAAKPFDLTTGPLVRTALLQLGAGEHAFLLTVHHIISDGWSLTVFFKELTAIYAAFREKKPSPLPELPIQYADFALWQRQWLQGPVLEKQLAYWKRQLADLPALRLPTDRPRPATPSFKGAFEVTSVSPELAAALRALSQREGATLFMTMLAAFKILLHRHTGQDDIVLGLPIANRNRAELEGLIGFFVNTLVMRTDLSGNPTFREALRRVKEVTLEADAHQDLPFEKLVEEVHPERDLSRNPLFQVTFQLFSAPLTGDQVAGTLPEAIPIQKGTSNVDLAFDLFDSLGTVAGPLEYSTDLFDAATISRMLAHYQELLQDIVKNPDRRISDLQMFSPEEGQQLLVDWNATGVEYPRRKRIHELFELQVERTPENIAVEFEGDRLTYRELNRRANQLAHHLRRLGVRRASLVGVCLERSAEMIVAVLGVLKAGSAYLPLDAGYPQERLAFMLADSGAPVLLVQSKLLERIPPVKARVLCLDADRGMIARSDGSNPKSAGVSDDLAYVIYTSGSTGRPKGVMVSHRALVNHMHWLHSAFPLTETDSMPQKYSLSFDVAALEIFVPLLAGACVVVARPGGHLDSSYLARLISERKITIIDLVPSMLEMLLDRPEFAECKHLRRIICGGEVLSPELAERCLAMLPVELINMYGPTEATISATFHILSGSWTGGPVPIGRPIANTRVYVLDKYGKPVPVGVYGELHICGDGLAKGYHNRPELTAERFVANPFGGGRMYKTGDLVRYLPEGSLEFSGRIDQQVKIRGFRIELGEIEYALAKHPSVQSCAVVPWQDRVVSYVVPKNDQPELWPSVGEYFIYDELLYYAMAHDERRNQKYRRAIERTVRGKTVVDPGTGADALLARMCVDCGAAKVYAIEMLDDAYRKARELVARLGLSDKIVLIHGDATTVELPEKADVCVSEVMGTIASSEGAAVLLEKVRRFLKDGGAMIPVRAATRIAAARLPEELAGNPRFSEISGPYAEKIFQTTGKPFDLRVCVKNFPLRNLISEPQTFEELNFVSSIQPEYFLEMELTIDKSSRLDGFLLWLNLWPIEGELIDTLAEEYSWLPVFFPTFYPGIEVSKGDVIRAVCRTALSDDKLTPDYRISGTLLRKSGGTASFEYCSLHRGNSLGQNPFYARLFADGWEQRYSRQDGGDSMAGLKKYLERCLPDYMLPSAFVLLKSLPLTPNGKLDRKALPAPDRTRPDVEQTFVEPRTQVENAISSVWRDLLNLDRVGADDNFFDLGGHSLLLVRVASRLRELLKTEVSIIDLFRYPTISSQAAYLKREVREPDSLQPVQSRAEKQREVIGLQQKLMKERITTS